MSDDILPRLKCVTHDQGKTMENKKKGHDAVMQNHCRK